jgi:hypothetical protein
MTLLRAASHAIGGAAWGSWLLAAAITIACLCDPSPGGLLGSDRDWWWAGASFGAVAGLAAGAGIGLAVSACSERTTAGFVGLVAGAALGALVFPDAPRFAVAAAIWGPVTALVVHARAARLGARERPDHS